MDSNFVTAEDQSLALQPNVKRGLKGLKISILCDIFFERPLMSLHIIVKELCKKQFILLTCALQFAKFLKMILRSELANSVFF